MKKSLQVGLGRAVITPRQNVQMSGFARSQVSTGVHDDLYSCAMYLEDARGHRALLLVLSLVCLSRDLVARIRKGLNEETGIPEEAIVFSCTHTHAGPGVVLDGYTVPSAGGLPVDPHRPGRGPRASKPGGSARRPGSGSAGPRSSSSAGTGGRSSTAGSTPTLRS